MDWFQVVSLALTGYVGLLTAIAIILWYIMRSTISEVKSVREDLTSHKIEVVKEYAKIVDVKEINNELMNSIKELQGTINTLAVNVATLTATMHQELANK